MYYWQRKTFITHLTAERQRIQLVWKTSYLGNIFCLRLMKRFNVRIYTLQWIWRLGLRFLNCWFCWRFDVGMYVHHYETNYYYDVLSFVDWYGSLSIKSCSSKFTRQRLSLYAKVILLNPISNRDIINFKTHTKCCWLTGGSNCIVELNKRILTILRILYRPIFQTISHRT